MWQRIQTLFLLLAASSIWTVAYFPVFTKIAAKGDKIYTLDAFFIHLGATGSQTSYVGWGAVGSSTLMLLAIFLYKNRSAQLRLCALNFLALGGIFVLSMYYVKTYFEPLEGTPGTYGLGAYGVVGAMIFNFLARTFIHKDQRAVQHAERLL